MVILFRGKPFVSEESHSKKAGRWTRRGLFFVEETGQGFFGLEKEPLIRRDRFLSVWRSYTRRLGAFVVEQQ